MEREVAWKKYDEASLDELEALAVDYIDFISENKTERECAAAAIAAAEDAGYDSLADCIAAGTPVGPGSKLWACAQGKAVILVHVGAAPISEGMNILGAHIDSPRLDIKQNPLYETNDFALLESAVREDLNTRATRVSAVINPVKLIITNYPEGQVEEMEAINNPEDPTAGTHTIEFSRELWMEREDFMEDAPKKYFRMTPGQEVRLKNAYIVKCTGCKKDEEGNIIEVYAEYDPDTKTGMPGSSRKVKGTLHWVSCAHCLKAEVRLYDRLWKVENPRDEMAAIREAKKCDALEAMKEMINPDSLHVLTECYVEKYLAEAKPLDYLQFQRIGYFNVDKDSTPEHLVFNRTVSLKDTWSKINK